MLAPIIYEYSFVISHEDFNRKKVSMQADMSSGGKTVLLVDDTIENQRTVALLLKQAGYRCIVASDGVKALEIMQNSKLDLVLMDCEMPVMDGWTATQTFREKETAGHHLPIIAVTAASSEEDKYKCKTAGMDGYLQKPFRAKELFEIIAFYTADDFGNFNRNQDTELPQLQPSARTTGATPPEKPWMNLQDFSPELLNDLAAKTKLVDPTLVQDLVNSLLSEFPSILEQLRQAVEGKDYEMLGDISHKMQSRCGRLGAVKLQVLFRDLEQMSKRNAAPADDLENYLNDAEISFGNVALCLQKFTA